MVAILHTGSPTLLLSSVLYGRSTFEQSWRRFQSLRGSNRRSEKRSSPTASWLRVDSRLENHLTNPEGLRAEDLGPQLLHALGIHPPWERIVAIVEFKVPHAPASTASTSTAMSPNPARISDTKQKRGSKSRKRSFHGTPTRIHKTSPAIERHTPPPASKVTSPSQNSSAKHSQNLHRPP